MSVLALCCLSHSPLLRKDDSRIAEALGSARRFVAEFDPELVIAFCPDHYNGFRYQLMPPFCVGTAATALGDYGTPAGPLDVPQETADRLVEHLLDAELDMPMAERMVVDHAVAQPLDILFGSLTAKPVIPIFINSLAFPLGPLRRIRRLGEAVGQFVKTLNRRVLLLGSGGLSHDPPVPKLREATPEAAAYLIDKRRSPEEQARREAQVFQAGQDFAAGKGNLRPLNPELDRALLDHFATGELTSFDRFELDSLTRQGGCSVHEVRTWLAAHAALASYRTMNTFYLPIPEWIVGFAVTTAVEVS